ncbi:GPALPP motifs-containing protein 1 [Madurella fahalii]|uniref:GPALPP motifs-containing protein 1 n=1 Tax=Madurella fahalii TaxID=1157608 RepID=A0ABQ0FYJ6_9PEZI
MASIGPQLPPHLQKRKRTSEDEAEVGSPPAKTSRRDNEDEIPLEDSSDDDFGPCAPPLGNGIDKIKGPSGLEPTIGPPLPPSVANSTASAPAEQKRSISPSLPPSAEPANEDEIRLGSDDDDNTPGPAPPPPPKTAGPALPPKRVIGPAPPPADLSERPTTGPDSDSDSDSDDDWGPALPTAAGANPKSATAGRSLPSSLEPQQPAAPKRDDWMLAPPTSSGYRAPDPTKLKNRKFASGPRAATSADRKPGGVSSIWTETPEEKARRLANAVLGREDPNSQPTSARPSRPDHPSSDHPKAADEARIRSYTEQTRGKSLVEEHQAARLAGKATNTGSNVKGQGGADDDDDDPSKRAFDWEKDMKVGGRISNSQRRDMLTRAANFGGRFQKGSYL